MIIFTDVIYTYAHIYSTLVIDYNKNGCAMIFKMTHSLLAIFHKMSFVLFFDYLCPGRLP